MKKAALTALLAALLLLPLGAATPSASSTTTALQCPDPTVTVGTMSELKSAVAAARPGDVIEMEPGTYAGRLTLERSGAKSNPIWLCGPREAVIDAGNVSSGRVIHMDDADNWRLVGFTVTNALKGLTISQVSNSVFAGLHVHHIGHEAVHLLSNSTNNIVRDNVIHDTGIVNPMFGEGVYIGTAKTNWGSRGVDYSNRNQVIGNTIYDTTAESIDIKEGTKNGVIRGNLLDGARITGQADSWITVKGQHYVIEDNVGRNAPEHGFEAHEIRTDGMVVGGGQDNVFRRNTAYHDGEGYAFYTRELPGVVVTCDNEVVGSGRFTDLALSCGEPEPAPESTQQPEPEPDPTQEPEPTLGSDSGARAGAHPGAVAHAHPEAEAHTRAEADAHAEANPHADAHADADPEAAGADAVQAGAVHDAHVLPLRHVVVHREVPLRLRPGHRPGAHRRLGR